MLLQGPQTLLTPEEEVARSSLSASSDQNKGSFYIISVDTNIVRILDIKKSRSFASALKRRFTKGNRKPRSHSADRAGSLKDGSGLLRPPDRSGVTARGNVYRCSDTRIAIAVSDDMYGGDLVPEDGLKKKGRSSSISSSLKKLFRGKKKVVEEIDANEMVTFIFLTEFLLTSFS